MHYETIIVETHGRVGLVRFNRPKAMNAINSQLIEEFARAIAAFEQDAEIGCLLVAGSEKAFAAGADIKELVDKTFVEALTQDFVGSWSCLAQARKPVVAAVAGFALGGGCELMLQCDVIIAADNAKFGQPEIKLGAIPGLGGTQRLTRAIGKAKAMELILTGRMMDACEAEAAGLVTRVVSLDKLEEEAMNVARAIAGMSLPALMLAKESVNRSFESSLAEGLLSERRALHALFATQDQKEGMRAFIEKRPPRFTNS
jgi:enoyl-CoA hydratase